MEPLDFETLAPIVFGFQIAICFAAVAVTCLLNQFAPKRYVMRWILITMIVGSGWSALTTFDTGTGFYIGVLMFLMSVFAMLVWVVWFQVWHLPRNTKSNARA